MQKQITILLIMAAALSGCTATREASNTSPSIAWNDDYSQKKAAEQAAWAQLKVASAERCHVSAAPPDRTQAVGMSDCVTELVKQYVLPHAVNPDLLMASRADALRIAQDYAAGKMTPMEYRNRSQERLREYSVAVLSNANQAGIPETMPASGEASSKD